MRYLARISSSDDGPRITALVIEGADLTSTTLKEIRFARLAGVFNWLLGPRNEQSEPLRSLSRQIAEAFGSADPEPDWRCPGPPRPTLTRPDGSNPEGHAEAVAAAYKEFALAGPHPALAIAREAGVPVNTARGWIQEARRRGKLPQGRKGRAG
jgi:hypothetical protein